MKHFSCFILSAIVLLTGCNRHFISDDAFRQNVSQDLSKRSEILTAAGVDLQSMDITQQEKEALEFLYAYMPLGDIVNMEPSYYLDHYRMMRKALKEMPWGKNVPEREMRHFVLPVRVNNENLDSARYVFYEELAPRIKGMSMKDAASRQTAMTAMWFMDHLQVIKGTTDGKGS